MNKRTLISLVAMLLCVPAFLLLSGAGFVSAEEKPPTTAATERDPNRLWCGEHDVYEDECVICHPELAEKLKEKQEQKAEKDATGEARDPNRLWCEEHGAYEDECVLCHPELAEKVKKAEEGKEKVEGNEEKRDPNRLWCGEHGIYEDECVICHPELKGKKNDGPKTELQCKEHHVPESTCGICHPELVSKLRVGEGMKVRFASGTSTLKAGVSMARPIAALAATQELLGQLTFNESRVATVAPLTDGLLKQVNKQVGDSVAEGEVIALVHSTAIAEARGAYRKALAETELAGKSLRREQDLYKKEISARRDLEEAEAAKAVAQSSAEEAKQRLASLGVDATTAAHTGETNALLPLRSPFSGTVIERSAAQGTAVTAGQALFQVADLSSVWMQLSVPEQLVAGLAAGGKVTARFEAYPGIGFEGQIDWISPSVDTQTRMITARATLQNTQGLLKKGMFGRASLVAANGGSVVSVPASAIQEVDGAPVVFRKLEDDLYEARRVELGARDGVQAAVVAGLAADEEIVTEGSYIVKSELLKARLGAGCTDE